MNELIESVVDRVRTELPLPSEVHTDFLGGICYDPRVGCMMLLFEKEYHEDICIGWKFIGVAK